MIKLLAIGNSYSEDATYYLHQILDAAGIENLVVNLYIGGCPLERHWENVESGAADYMYQRNGVKTDRYVSIPEMLHEEDWDILITHQASHDSGWEDTYEPFLGLLADYLHKEVPGAALWMNETWAYEPDSDHGKFIRYNRSQQEMFTRLRRNYYKMAAKYDMPLVPCGDLIQKLRSTPVFDRAANGRSICRDGFHMHYLYGRFALAGMWAHRIFGVTMAENTFVPHTDYLPEEEAELPIIELIRKTIDETEMCPPEELC